MSWVPLRSLGTHATIVGPLSGSRVPATPRSAFPTWLPSHETFAPCAGPFGLSLGLPAMGRRKFHHGTYIPAVPLASGDRMEKVMAGDVDKAWDLMEEVQICMLVTHDGSNLRARPMGAYVRRHENAIYFLT